MSIDYRVDYFFKLSGDIMQVNVDKMSGSDLQGVDKIIRTVSNGTVYNEVGQILMRHGNNTGDKHAVADI